jgi:hypothetical protein
MVRIFKSIPRSLPNIIPARILKVKAVSMEPCIQCSKIHVLDKEIAIYISKIVAPIASRRETTFALSSCQ